MNLSKNITTYGSVFELLNPAAPSNKINASKRCKVTVYVFVDLHAENKRNEILN